MSFKLEICSFDLASALTAQDAGAHRIELCAGPAEGGTTPGPGVIRAARERLHIDLYPIIRPRGGDFLYSDEEYDTMLKEVAWCKDVGCNGVVIGILKADGTIDKKRAARLVDLAYPLGVTFHRAFDWAANPFEAMEDIISIGCERILTSGQRPAAIEGATMINELVRQADDRIVIMPGSGVRSENILQLLEKTDANEFHTSARTKKSSQMEFINEAMKEDQSVVAADGPEIEKMIGILAARERQYPA
ncbi:copper homeostasis protein CutC [Flavitalea sp. BT771]|uniref:copper homeostasis protein CutC n=1 Tax=Flavitalea sp. BT771 TaxID=3063329 RepID=UPI0026E30923|nr:copper homeostasis protein CutC [Flavitalea sp. BT771]MDO6431176.1 copper homeostasis protein CutC [Flavitalea sp. BT771]MDV6220083.1 copper homeostasis protein CutC [Flavitalea sp. BT771]